MLKKQIPPPTAAFRGCRTPHTFVDPHNNVGIFAFNYVDRPRRAGRVSTDVDEGFRDMVFGSVRGRNATGLIVTWHDGTGCESGSTEIVFEGVSAGGERKFLHSTLVSMRMLILPLTASMTGRQNTTQPKAWRSSSIFDIRWHEEAIDDLKKIDRRKQRKTIDRVKNHLSKDPYGLGKPLKGLIKGLYRYRCGPYRIICAIDRESVIILILRTAEGRDVYNDPVKGNRDS